VKNKTTGFEKTPIGYIPTADYFAGLGLEIKNIDEILSVDASGYLKELEEVKPFLESFGDKMPEVLWKEFYDLRARLENSLR
jgi:phosphoenolpyruvate carboxykinase (GTP)